VKRTALTITERINTRQPLTKGLHNTLLSLDSACDVLLTVIILSFYSRVA